MGTDAAVTDIALILTPGFYHQGVVWKTRTQDSELLLTLEKCYVFSPESGLRIPLEIPKPLKNKLALEAVMMFMSIFLE